MNKFVKTILITVAALIISIAISVIPLLIWAVRQPVATESTGIEQTMAVEIPEYFSIVFPA